MDFSKKSGEVQVAATEVGAGAFCQSASEHAIATLLKTDIGIAARDCCLTCPNHHLQTEVGKYGEEKFVDDAPPKFDLSGLHRFAQHWLDSFPKT